MQLLKHCWFLCSAIAFIPIRASKTILWGFILRRFEDTIKKISPLCLPGCFLSIKPSPLILSFGAVLKTETVFGNLKEISPLNRDPSIFPNSMGSSSRFYTDDFRVIFGGEEVDNSFGECCVVWEPRKFL